jgi:uncharacterized protein YdhG (YjbR/CyaY superfamily)
MQSGAKSVKEYLASLPAKKREALEAVRKVIRKNLPKGFVELMDFGMISYAIPLDDYPQTYNGHPLGVAALAAQKQYNSVYLLSVYSDPKTEAWFTKEYAKSGKRLNMGKSCVRFQTAEDLPLELIGKVVGLVSKEEFLRRYEASRAKTKSSRKAGSKAPSS